MRPPADRPSSRFARLFDAKLTPGVALAFFVALAAMCAAAAGIGAVAQHLRHAPIHR